MSISALIIAKNEALMIENCIKSVAWCDEVLVIDDGSTDETRDIAESLGATVISFKHDSFSRLREEALKRAKSAWIFYIDADERVTPTLAKEIKVLMETSDASVLRVQRDNSYFGKKFTAGGWQDDWTKRVFLKSALVGWFGDVHESPKYTGPVVDLQTKLIHFTHRDVVSGLLKSAAWTPIEAKALYKSGVADVTLFTLLRKGFMEFFRRAFLKKGYADGMEGMVEALIQGINRILVYIQVWELQQKPSISDKYKEKESEIIALWKKQ